MKGVNRLKRKSRKKSKLLELNQSENTKPMRHIKNKTKNNKTKHTTVPLRELTVSLTVHRGTQTQVKPVSV